MITGTTASTIVDHIIEAKGLNLRVVAPLGIGKPILLLNELYQRAKSGKLEHLTIFTALSLNPPTPPSDIISQRLLTEAYDRIYDGCIPLDYLTDRVRNELPDNVRIEEFYSSSGSVLTSEQGQQNHRSINYAQTLDYIRQADFNVFLNLVASAGDNVDFSCNTDFASILVPEFLEHPLDERPFIACEINHNLPIFGPDSQFPKERFDAVLDPGWDNYSIIPIPSQSPNDAEYAIGIRAASMIKDNGTLQIGIGRIGEAMSWALIQRHKNNDLYRNLYAALQPTEAERDLTHKWGGLGVFDDGLHASTEMFVEGILQMYDAGIVKREVDGFCINGGFFAGSNRFYQRLRHMSQEDRQRIRMKDIAFTNLLYGDEEAKRAARINARFVNQAMLFSITGAACSDGLADGRLVSGVGGQYEFVVQGHQLKGARSILMAASTRHRRGKFSSNIVVGYGHCTIPRHLRDIVITEYGVADLRYKTEAEVAAAMIEIADRNFQDELRDHAIKTHKLPKSYEIPEHARRNTPEWLRDQLRSYRRDGSLPISPFGSQYTDIELGLLAARRSIAAFFGNIRNLHMPDLEGVGIRSFIAPPHDALPYLERVNLVDVHTVEERVARALIVHGLIAQGII